MPKSIKTEKPAWIGRLSAKSTVTINADGYRFVKAVFLQAR